MNKRLSKYKSHFGGIDINLVIAILVLCTISTLNLFSAGFVTTESDNLTTLQYLTSSKPALKQLTYFSIGSIIITIILFIPLSFFNKTSWWIYGVCLGLLIIVAKYGVIVKGSRRWIDLGIFNLQPAEVVKMGVILALANYFSKNPPKNGENMNINEMIIPVLIFIIPSVLIMLQPDLGTSLTVIATGAIMVLFAGVNQRYVFITLLTSSVLFFPAWNLLHDYQKKRIMVLFDSETDPLGSGYHITQSKIAVGSGEIFGKGFLNGSQSQLEFLPEHHTDFVFSVLAEEWGFFGSTSLVILYLYIITRIFNIASRTKELFTIYLVIGFGSIFFVHTLINLGMVLGIFPVVGIPLPLMSYGGSSVISTMTGLGIILAVSFQSERKT